MKPFYKSKKFWASLTTTVTAIVSLRYGGEHAEVAALIVTTIGVAFVGATGMADFGKESK